MVQYFDTVDDEPQGLGKALVLGAVTTALSGAAWLWATRGSGELLDQGLRTYTQVIVGFTDNRLRNLLMSVACGGAGYGVFRLHWRRIGRYEPPRPVRWGPSTALLGAAVALGIAFGALLPRWAVLVGPDGVARVASGPRPAIEHPWSKATSVEVWCYGYVPRRSRQVSSYHITYDVVFSDGYTLELGDLAGSVDSNGTSGDVSADPEKLNSWLRIMPEIEAGLGRANAPKMLRIGYRQEECLAAFSAFVDPALEGVFHQVIGTRGYGRPEPPPAAKARW